MITIWLLFLFMIGFYSNAIATDGKAPDELQNIYTDYGKLILSFVSILAGWFLAQITGILKEYFNRRKLRKYLIEELKELETELERTLLIYARQLQIHALKGIDNQTPIHLSNHIFSNYYKDVVLSLNKFQRISFQMIHTLVENINLDIDEHKETTKRLQEKYMLEGYKSITNDEGTLWGQKVISAFTNVAMAIWHIRFHLDNQSSPDLTPFSDKHQQYLMYLENVEREISNIMQAAQKLDRKEFEKIYNPENFLGRIL